MAASDFELFVTLHRTSDNITEDDHTIKFASAPETVKDLKVAIENEFSIPQCLQTLTISDRHIKSDEDKLSDLYVYNCDRVKVSYLHEVDASELKELTSLLRELKKSLTDRPSRVCNRDDIDEQVLKLYNRTMRMLDQSSYGLLVPWLSDHTTSNRKYLVQIGAIEVVVSLLKYLQTNFKWSERAYESMELEETMLSFLWNFAETTESQEPVLSCGGFEVFLTSMTSVEIEDFDRLDYTEVFMKAIGCVSNYCESPSCQLMLANKKNALLFMLKFAINGQPDSFTRILIANCFLRVSRSLQSHQYLSDPDIVNQLLSFSKHTYIMANGVGQRTSDYSLIVYALLLAFGRLVLLSSVTKVKISSDQIAEFTQLTKKFISVSNIAGMRSLQEEYSNNWNTLIQFVEPILSPDSQSGNCGLVERNEFKKLFFFALKVELPRRRLQQVARKEELLEYLTCLQWYTPDDEGCSTYSECLPKLFDNKPTPVPQLITIVRCKLAVKTSMGFKDIQLPAQNIVNILLGK